MLKGGWRRIEVWSAFTWVSKAERFKKCSVAVCEIVFALVCIVVYFGFIG